MRAAIQISGLAAFMAATTVSASKFHVIRRTESPSRTVAPGTLTTLAPRQSVDEPVRIAHDPWQCATEDLQQYFDVPKPTRRLLSELSLYGLEVYAPCTSAGTLIILCPYPAQSSWCSFSATAPSDVLPTYSAYGSQAYSWWSARSSTVSALSARCPVRWYNASFRHANGDM
ncbi:hypothetical protein VF21_09851 [Pseudogymnoascus sp. 05NY08]|nr:hypothetical protein VF21_09851 [Pseudogymnoascus sp. 05NY08]